MKSLTALIVVGLLSLLSASASAQPAVGAVKVECWGYCDLVTLGQVCDSYWYESEPVGISCDDTGYGFGWDVGCGSATCRPYGDLWRSDQVKAYCDDGGGYDAIVMCAPPGTLVDAASSAQERNAPKRSDQKQ